MVEKPTYTTKEEVMFFDTDIGGVVHNLAYLRMIETCRTKLAGLMGMDLRAMADTQFYPVVVSTDIQYKRSGTLGDTIRIEGRLAEVEKVKFWCEFTAYRDLDDTPLVVCRQSLAMVQMPAARPQRLPKEWRDKWGY